jgi:hypothetical protein
MRDKQKVLSRDTYLKAFALFTMACARYNECRVFEAQLGKEVGDLDEHGNVEGLSDALYAGDVDFDHALKRAGYTVEPPAP